MKSHSFRTTSPTQRSHSRRHETSRRRTKVARNRSTERVSQTGHSTGSLNSLLAFRGTKALSPLEFDLTLDPSHILINHQKGAFSMLTPQQFSTSATTSSITSVYISCNLLPWTINIRSKSPELNFVTVGDIIHDLFNALRTRATHKEWDALSIAKKRRVRAAWIHRCKRQASLADQGYEEKEGVRRVDFLGPNAGFCGLSQSSSTDH